MDVSYDAAVPFSGLVPGGKSFMFSFYFLKFSAGD
jgi:hypothetical protein